MFAPIPYSEFAARALNLCKPPIRRPATHEKLRQVLSEFSAICQTTQDVGLDAVASWLSSHPGRAPLTSFSLLRAFSRAVKLGKSQGLLPCNPFEAMAPSSWFATGLLDVPDTPRHLTREQIAAMLDLSRREAESGDWAAMRDAFLVSAYAHSGCRRNEILGMEVADLDLANGVLIIRPNEIRPLKTRMARRKIPMPPRLCRDAAVWAPQCRSDRWLVPHKGLTGPWMSGRPGTKPLDRIKAIGKRAGIANATISAIRHGYATAIEELSSELARQRLLGHRRGKTQYGYAHEDLVQLRRVADNLSYD